jgi:hypothetical protein
MKKFIIQDWAGNIMFHGKTFKTFEDAWEFLYEKFPNDGDLPRDEQYLQEFYVEAVEE